MEITDLIAEARATVVDEATFREIKESVKLAEDRFEESSKAKSVNAEFLSRSYSL